MLLHERLWAKADAAIGLPTIVEALRFRIEQFGWTDMEFARRVGMNRHHFSEVMSGKRQFPLSARIKAYKLGVPANVLLQ